MSHKNPIPRMQTAGRFPDLYFRLRFRERRIYSNQELAQLPDVYPGDQHYAEWRIRQRSCAKLLRYLRAKGRPLRVLDVGCGNGWMSNKMASIKGVSVLGIDIGEAELEQARSVFSSTASLQFENHSIDDLLSAGNQSFDII